MKKMYLTPTLPETSSGRLPVDVRQRLADYTDGKNQMQNIPPHVRPQALVKYDTNKIATVKEQEEGEEGEADEKNSKLTIADEVSESNIFIDIPQKYLKKAKLIYNFIENKLLPEDLELRHLLRDLSVPLGPIRSPLTSLQVFFSNLLKDNRVPKRLFTAVIKRRILEHVSPKTKKSGTLSSKPSASEPRPLAQAQSGSSYDTPRQGQLNTWLGGYDKIVKPSWTV